MNSDMEHAEKVRISRLMDKAEAENDFTGFAALAERLAELEGHDAPTRREITIKVTTEAPGTPND